MINYCYTTAATAATAATVTRQRIGIRIKQI